MLCYVSIKEPRTLRNTDVFFLYSHTGGLIIITFLLSAPNYHWKLVIYQNPPKRKAHLLRRLHLHSHADVVSCCCHWTDGRARSSLEPRESSVLRTTHYTCFSKVSRIFLRRAQQSRNVVTAAATQSRGATPAPLSLTQCSLQKKHYVGT